MKLVDLNKVREDNDIEHSEKLKKLLTEYPEIAKNLILISPDTGMVLFPKDVDPMYVIGWLETAKQTLIPHFEVDGE